jgi:hypothetical protein
MVRYESGRPSPCLTAATPGVATGPVANGRCEQTSREETVGAGATYKSNYSVAPVVVFALIQCPAALGELTVKPPREAA